MSIFHDVWKEHKDEFIALNVDVSGLGSHRACKGDAEMWASLFTVVPTNKYIFLHEVWSTVNMNSYYLQYELPGSQFLSSKCLVLTQ